MVDKRVTSIFVIQRFGRDADGVFRLISSAAAKAGASVTRADLMDASATSTLERVLGGIQSASLLIADISDANPNVMYELGYAQAQNKPLILIASGLRHVPSNLAAIQVLVYDAKAPEDLVPRLADAIASAIKSPETFTLSRAVAEAEKRRSVFISYSHQDRDFLDRLLVHLKPLERDGLIDLWVDARLRAGDKWKKEIEKALRKARVAVLLVSADFLASDFITDNELPPLLRNAEEQGTRIIPVIVKPCRFVRDKNLRHFQAVNDPKSALILLNAGEQESYFDIVAAEIESLLQRG